MNYILAFTVLCQLKEIQNLNVRSIKLWHLLQTILNSSMNFYSFQIILLNSTAGEMLT